MSRLTETLALTATAPSTPPDAVERSPRHALTGAADHLTPVPRWVRAVERLTVGPLTLIVGGYAAGGQHGFARWAGVPDPWAWGATAVFELTMVAFLLRGYLRARDNLSPAGPWAIAVAIGGLSVFTNVVHTTRVGAGIFYGAASAGVLALWLAKLFDAYRRVLREQGKIIVPVGKFGRVWLLNPRLAWRAMLVGTFTQSDDVSTLLRLAWTWRAVHRSARLRDLTRDLAKITAWNAVYTAVGLPTIDLPPAAVAEVTLLSTPHPIGVEVGDPPVDAWAADEVAELAGTRRSAVKDRGHLTAAPVSPAPVTSADDQLRKWMVTYRDQISAVQSHVEDCRTRPERVTAAEISAAMFAAQAAGTLDKVRTGQGTLLRIRRAVEALSDRGPIPDP